VITAAKQQLGPDRRLVCVDVQAIGQPKQPVVLIRIIEIEDRLALDLNVADARAGGFELGIRR
jgi:hypothetical protein